MATSNANWNHYAAQGRGVQHLAFQAVAIKVFATVTAQGQGLAVGTRQHECGRLLVQAKCP